MREAVREWGQDAESPPDKQPCAANPPPAMWGQGGDVDWWDPKRGWRLERGRHHQTVAPSVFRLTLWPASAALWPNPRKVRGQGSQQMSVLGSGLTENGCGEWTVDLCMEYNSCEVKVPHELQAGVAWWLGVWDLDRRLCISPLRLLSLNAAGWVTALLLACGGGLLMPSDGRASFGVSSSCSDTNLIRGAPPSWLLFNAMTSRRPCLQMPSQWGVGLHHRNGWGAGTQFSPQHLHGTWNSLKAFINSAFYLETFCFWEFVIVSVFFFFISFSEAALTLGPHVLHPWIIAMNHLMNEAAKPLH